MSIEQNKALVTKTWKMLLGGEADAALASFADDATWWLSGTLEGISGVKKGRAELTAFMGNVAAAFPDGLRTEILKTYGDGDTVILELVNRGTSATGKPYENEYCFVFELAGGKIRAIREYVDLEKVKIALSA
jgi:ketosteroid isomerase-like protein